MRVAVGFSGEEVPVAACRDGNGAALFAVPDGEPPDEALARPGVQHAVALPAVAKG